MLLVLLLCGAGSRQGARTVKAHQPRAGTCSTGQYRTPVQIASLQKQIASLGRCQCLQDESFVVAIMIMMDWGSHAAGLGTLACLSYELLEHIFLAPSLTARDLLSLSVTSHILNVLCLEEPLWMKHCLRGYNMRLTYVVRASETFFHDVLRVHNNLDPRN